MSKQQPIHDSPLARKRLTIGAPLLEGVEANEDSEPQQKDIKTQKHTNIKDAGDRTQKSEGEAMKRTTVYMPESLAVRLKIYAARHKDDMSGIIVKLVEELLKNEE
jgi:hypothetical protein